MTLYEILINDILGVFIDVNALNYGINNWAFTYLDIFKVFYVIVVSYIVIWLFLILPFKILQRFMRYKQIKGGK